MTTTEIQRHTDQDGSGRFALLVDGQPAGEMDLRTVEGRLVVTHTGIREAYEGQGLAGKLARHVLDEARADGVQVVPLCPFLAGYLDKHPDDQDLIDQDLYAQLKR